MVNRKRCFFCVFLPLALFVACSSGEGESEGELPISSQDRVTYVDPHELQPAQGKSTQLSDKQLADIELIHNALKEVDPTSLEQKQDDFSRDQNPEKEIKIWLEIVAAYQAFEKGMPTATLPQKSEAYTLLLLRSMMPTEKALQEQPLKALSETEARAVLEGFKLKAEPITVLDSGAE